MGKASLNDSYVCNAVKCVCFRNIEDGMKGTRRKLL